MCDAKLRPLVGVKATVVIVALVVIGDDDDPTDSGNARVALARDGCFQRSFNSGIVRGSAGTCPSRLTPRHCGQSVGSTFTTA